MTVAINPPAIDYSSLSDDERKSAGFQKIGDKWYWMVAPRLSAFLAANPTFAIRTKIATLNDEIVIFRAKLIDEEGTVRATGTAYEKHSGSRINQSSSIEVAETSAVGRCLAMAGWGGGEFSSADELVQALGVQNEIRDTALWKMAMGEPRDFFSYIQALPEESRGDAWQFDKAGKVSAYKERYRQLMAAGSEAVNESMHYLAQALESGKLDAFAEHWLELSEVEQVHCSSRMAEKYPAEHKQLQQWKEEVSNANR